MRRLKGGLFVPCDNARNLMATLANDGIRTHAARPVLDHKPSSTAAIGFFIVLALGIGYGIHGLLDDINSVHEPLALGVFALLGLALVIALGFEFVNGFHDTANAVATVIYTHAMPPVVAVVWSGCFNLIGVLVSTGAVAFGIVTLLPVELILQVGSGAGYAMIFALLLAAIAWNLGTWAMGIPNSSSHALIGSIMGVGLANQLMAPKGRRHLGRRLGSGGQGAGGAAVQPADGLRLFRPAAVGDEDLHPLQEAV